MEKTLNGIEYELSINANDVFIYLYPLIEKHTDKHVKIAEKWLFASRINIQARWKSSEDTTEPPCKIPDYAIIKQMGIEIGKLKAYIAELEEKLEDKKNVEKDNTKLKRQVCNLRTDNSTLICELTKYKSNI